MNTYRNNYCCKECEVSWTEEDSAASWDKCPNCYEWIQPNESVQIEIEEDDE